MKKDLLILGTIALIAFVLLSGTKFQSVEEYYLTHADDIQEDSEVVTLEIDCKTILNNYAKLKPALQSEKYVPADGVILKETKYVLRQGDTVFDILVRATRNNKIQMEYQGAEKNAYGSAYIQGINHIYEQDCGALSGWMYLVNGKAPSYGCSRYEPKNGDTIVFAYTCDLGRDIGADMTQLQGSKEEQNE